MNAHVICDLADDLQTMTASRPCVCGVITDATCVEQALQLVYRDRGRIIEDIKGKLASSQVHHELHNSRDALLVTMLNTVIHHFSKRHLQQPDLGFGHVPYNFEFLTLTDPVGERSLKRGLLIHLRDLSLEPGGGFAFIGSQVPLPVGKQTFYLDLLFYHVRLHSYFVIELKTGEFKLEYAGELNFYLAAVDGIMKTDRDDPTIGLLLCETENEAISELSFKNLQTPIARSPKGNGITSSFLSW